ncbi:AAA family ATPase [Candidatus Saccharibacteria bacterium]|nr:AAA family ATPase [Candidatus Saccharibacteria bacterium]
MEFTQFKNEFLAYLEQNKNSIELKKKVDLRRQFNEEYPLSALEEMTLQDYAIGTGSKDTLCYLLERGRYKDTGMGIGGGSALKFGIYYSKDDGSYQIRTSGQQHKTVENPDEYWENFRGQLCGFLKELVETGDVDENYLERFPELKGTGMFLSKLAFLYVPDKYLNTTNQPSEFALKILEGAHYAYRDRVIKPVVLWRELRSSMSEVDFDEYDPQLIGDAVFDIFKRFKPKNEPIRVSKKEFTENEEQEPVIGGKNKIYYGTPGCGKSYLVKEKYGDSSDDFRISFRTVFHPDYTNSDFVGQVVPITTENGSIRYEFVPGPFTEALREAMKKPWQRVSLIIDEINRGNAAAIFGDIVQLLDRNDSGESEYVIHSKQISDYLNRNGVSSVEDDISLPSNLWIIGTMNTSDQNVFPLDTAFKRRWEMHKIRNDFKNVDSDFYNMYVPGTEVRWKDFVAKINQKIASTSSYGLNSDDKQIGVYFVDKNTLSRQAKSDDLEKKQAFGEKVLMYIWEDVAKLNRTDWFGDKISSLDELLDEFENIGLKVFNGIDFPENNYEENA